METRDNPIEQPQIAGYDIKRYLGAGGSGRIWVVQDHSTGQEVVVKIPTYDESLRPGTSLLADVHHEFLVEELGVVESTLGVGLLMEYCPAGSAAAVVAARGPLSVGEVLTVIAPIAEALEFLHEQGLSHGDVSPRNILFTAEGKPKLGDFGNRALRGQTPGNYGTSGFCAPEVAGPGESGELEPARDIYALAACTWYLLTGRAPASTINRIPIGAMVPEVNDGFAMLLEDGLAEDPKRRPSAGQFAQRIFGAGKPVAVELGSAVEPEALKHMLTTLQSPPRRKRLGHAGKSRRAAKAKPGNDAKSLPPRKDREQQKPRDPLHEQKAERHWAQTHEIHGLGSSKRKLVIATLLGMAFVGVGAVAAQSISATGTRAEVVDEMGMTGASSTDDPGRLTGTSPLEASSSKEVLLAATELTMRRDKMLMTGRASGLESVHVPGSPSGARDKEVLARMKGNGLSLLSLKTTLSDAFVVGTGTDGRAIVEATSSQSGYKFADAKGKVLLTARTPERQTVRIDMRQSAGSWKIWDVVPVEGK